MARASGAHLGAPLYISNQITFNTFAAAANYNGQLSLDIK